MGGEFENVSRGKVRRVLEPSRIMMVVIPKGDGVNILPICFHNWCGFKPSLYLAAIHNVNYSYELMEAAKEFVLAVPGRSMADEVEYFGTVSGRDRDKVKDFGMN
jgi:flavin reductase (DIM6/NTAB) family NADH-FMN oxidoreductase RutF